MPMLRRWSLLALPLAVLAMAPGARAQTAPKLFFEGDMVRGAAVHSGAPCVLTSQFKHKEMVAFRVRVTDANGKQYDKAALKSLVVVLNNGLEIPMHYHGHPPKDATDFFWAIGWIIPDDFPTGSMSYKVVATDLAGNSQVWTPFKVAASQFTVLAGDFEPPK
jgi:hypothetical protein